MFLEVKPTVLIKEKEYNSSTFLSLCTKRKFVTIRFVLASAKQQQVFAEVSLSSLLREDAGAGLALQPGGARADGGSGAQRSVAFSAQLAAKP